MQTVIVSYMYLQVAIKRHSEASNTIIGKVND